MLGGEASELENVVEGIEKIQRSLRDASDLLDLAEEEVVARLDAIEAAWREGLANGDEAASDGPRQVSGPKIDPPEAIPDHAGAFLALEGSPDGL